MLLSNNPWVEMWESAKPVPANKQKRLFDDTREAEKVLHFLDTRTLAQISEILLPVVAQAAVCRLDEEAGLINLPNGMETLSVLLKSVERLSREEKAIVRRYENLVQEMAQMELSISKVNSLHYKFNPVGASNEVMDEFVSGLFQGKELEIPDGSESDLGRRLQSLFADGQKSTNSNSELGQGAARSSIFPEAFEKEFVMRVSAPRPAVYSSRSPQFLRAFVSKNEFRLCGAFSEDMVFF